MPLNPRASIRDLYTMRLYVQQEYNLLAHKTQEFSCPRAIPSPTLSWTPSICCFKDRHCLCHFWTMMKLKFKCHHFSRKWWQPQISLFDRIFYLLIARIHAKIERSILLWGTDWSEKEEHLVWNLSLSKRNTWTLQVK